MDMDARIWRTLRENITLLLITRLARYARILANEGMITYCQCRDINRYCFTGTKKCERRFNDRAK